MLFLAGVNVILVLASAENDISIFQSLLSPLIETLMDNIFLCLCFLKTIFKWQSISI